MVNSGFSCYFVFVFLAVFVPFNVLAATTAKEDDLGFLNAYPNVVEQPEEREKRQAAPGGANGKPTNNLNWSSDVTIRVFLRERAVLDSLFYITMQMT